MKIKNIKHRIIAILIIALCVIVSGCGVNNNVTTTDNNNSDNTVPVTSDTTISGTVNNTSKCTVQKMDFQILPDTCQFYSNSLFGVFEYNEKYGLVNTEGKVVIEPKYKCLSAPSENFLIAEKSDNTFVVITTGGQEVGNINYTGGKISIHNKSTVTSENCDDGTGEFSDGLAFMNVTNSKSDIQSICINTNGKVVFESKYNLLGKFNNKVAIGEKSKGIYSKEKALVAVDENGNKLWEKNTANFPTNTCVKSLKIKDDIIVYMTNDSKWGAININGKQVINCDYEELTYAGNGLIGYKKYGLWGYMDYDSNVIIEPKYNEAYDFRGGKSAVKDEKQYNFIDTTGKVLFSCESNNYMVDYYENGLVLKDGSELLDNNGNSVLKVDISNNGIGGTANRLVYDGGNIICKKIKEVNQTVSDTTCDFYKIIID